jgi:ParB family chromosome partitioning protein
LDAIQQVPVGAILAGSPLRTVNATTVEELANSIKEIGLLQPILLRPSGHAYELVFGQHRFEACKRLGWSSIPAFIRFLSDDECFLTKLVENLQRNVEINPLTEAEGYIRLLENGWTITKIAERIGKSDSYVSDRIGLIRRLAPAVASKANGSGHIRPSHLEILSRIKSKEEQLSLSDLVERKRMSVRTLEQLVSKGQPVIETVESQGEHINLPIPKQMAEQLGIQPGAHVLVFARKKRIIIQRCPDENSDSEEL